MRILVVSCVFIPEPVVSAQISKDIAIALTERGNQITVLAPTPSRPSGFNFDGFHEDESKVIFKRALPGVKVVNVDSKTSPNSTLFGRFRESWSFGRAVATYLNQSDQNFDMVYINSWPIFSQYLIAKACLKLSIPYVVHIQDIYPESLSNKLPKILGKVVNMVLLPFDKYHLENAKKIIVISENMMEEICRTRNIRKDSFEVVSNWQDEKAFESAIPRDEGRKFTFMYLGNIGPIAGVEILINAFILSNLKECQLIIAGNGANKQSCIALSLKNSAFDIRFIDVPNGEVANTQNLADVLLLPVIKGAASSSIPSKLPAYMFSAKPIIATLDSNSATANAILEAECGWVGPPADIIWLANQMNNVAKMSKVLLSHVGKLGYEYGLANFSKQINLNKILKHLSDD